MIITLSGVQSSGKTTLLNTMKEDKFFENFYFKEEIVRSINNRKYPINEQTTNLSQLKICHEHFNTILEDNLNYPNIISDRCAIDAYIYARYLHEKGNIEDYVLEYAKTVHNICFNLYDYKFLLLPEFQPKEDGVRSINNEFYFKINSYFEMLQELSKDIIVLTGTTTERLQQMKDHIFHEELKKELQNKGENN